MGLRLRGNGFDPFSRKNQGALMGPHASNAEKVSSPAFRRPPVTTHRQGQPQMLPTASTSQPARVFPAVYRVEDHRLTSTRQSLYRYRPFDRLEHQDLFPSGSHPIHIWTSLDDPNIGRLCRHEPQPNSHQHRKTFEQHLPNFGAELLKRYDDPCGRRQSPSLALPGSSETLHFCANFNETTEKSPFERTSLVRPRRLQTMKNFMERAAPL